MTSRNLVTVGLPVYNGETYVADAIRSILAQDSADLELIVSDNGSVDETEEICRDAIRDDSRARYVRSDVNRGAAWNFNHVVHLARGRYFKWAAHDDLHSQRFLARSVDVLEEDSDVSLVFGRVIDIDADGREINRRPSYDVVIGGRPSARVRAFLQEPTPCFETFGVTRLRQLRQTGLIGAYTSSDRTFLFEMALRGRFHELQEEYLYHREHQDRSVYRYVDRRERAAWFDTGASTIWTFSHWRRLVEQVRGVSRARLGPTETARCQAMVCRWAITSAESLARDVVGAARRKARSG